MTTEETEEEETEIVAEELPTEEVNSVIGTGEIPAETEAENLKEKMKIWYAFSLI